MQEQYAQVASENLAFRWQKTDKKPINPTYWAFATYQLRILTFANIGLLWKHMHLVR